MCHSAATTQLEAVSAVKDRVRYTLRCSSMDYSKIEVVTPLREPLTILAALY